MSEENPEGEIDGAKREADEELGEMEDNAEKMGERLAEHESAQEELEVPQPDHGDDLSMSEPKDKEAAGVAEPDIPEDQDEAAEEAGQ